jgi:3-oxoacyl-[acyl-carrier protein] reductase
MVERVNADWLWDKVVKSKKVDLSLENKVVVVTGGTRGIGLAVSKAFLNEGAKVHVIARNENVVLNSQLEKEFPKAYFFYQCDVTSEVSISNVCNKILEVENDVIDIVVANVGSGKSVAAAISDAENWESSWNINFNSALLTARVFHSTIQKTKGSLLFISSIAGQEFIGAPTDYSTAKSALISFAKILSHKIAPLARVNVIAPGNIYSEDGTWGNKMKINPKAVLEMIDNKVPLKRFGTPEEVSDLVLFLSSSRASFITGSCFTIDGGQTVSFN